MMNGEGERERDREGDRLRGKVKLKMVYFFLPSFSSNSYLYSCMENYFLVFSSLSFSHSSIFSLILFLDYSKFTLNFCWLSVFENRTVTGLGSGLICMISCIISWLRHHFHLMYWFSRFYHFSFWGLIFPFVSNSLCYHLFFPFWKFIFWCKAK